MKIRWKDLKELYDTLLLVPHDWNFAKLTLTVHQNRSDYLFLNDFLEFWKINVHNWFEEWIVCCIKFFKLMLNDCFPCYEILFCYDETHWRHKSRTSVRKISCFKNHIEILRYLKNKSIWKSYLVFLVWIALKRIFVWKIGEKSWLVGILNKFNEPFAPVFLDIGIKDDWFDNVLILQLIILSKDHVKYWFKWSTLIWVVSTIFIRTSHQFS